MRASSQAMATPTGKLMVTVKDQTSSELPERSEQAGPVKGVDPVIDSPGARLDKPVVGGVEAVD